MKTRILSSVVAMLISTGIIQADPIVMTTAGLGYSSYEYNDYSTFEYPFLDLSVNVGWSNIYVAFNANLPLSEADTSTFDDDWESRREDTLHRNQYAADIGYKFDIGVAVFAGINYADSKIDTRYTDILFTVETGTKETGYHIGIAGQIYSWNGIGSINAKAAYALTNIDISYSDNQQQSFSLDGNGDGYLFGVGWFGIITENLNYYLDFDGYRYSYDVKDVSFDSNQFNYKVGLSYIF